MSKTQKSAAKGPLRPGRALPDTLAAPRLRLEAQGSTLRLTFPAGWLEANPLTRADLRHEQAFLAPAGMMLEFA